MGVEARRRPPLPAPTESTTFPSGDDAPGPGDDLATDISRRTDRTSVSIPEDGSPIVVNTHKREKESAAKGPQPSQTSLLIEYFEGGKGPSVHSRPSVRVKLTPSSGKKSRSSKDHIQITEGSGARKPSYTRRISLGPKNAGESHILEGEDVSTLPDDSNVSSRPPVEIEVLHKEQSDVSGTSLSRESRYIPINPSQVSSMPPESFVDEDITPEPRSRSFAKDAAAVVGAGAAAATAVSVMDTLKTPSRRRSRSLSRERIARGAVEKLKNDPPKKHKHGSRSRSVSKEQLTESVGSPRKHRRRSNEVSAGEPSLLTASQVSDARSFRTDTSKSSINNPRLLATVEDAIRRLILPELTALKAEQKTQQNLHKFEKGQRDSVTTASTASREELTRRVSKHASDPNVRVKSRTSPSDRKHKRRDKLYDSPSDERFERGMSEETVIRDAKPAAKRSGSGHGLRNAVLGAAAGGLLTRAALQSHDSRSSLDRASQERRERRRPRSSRGPGSRSHSVSTAERGGAAADEGTAEDIFDRADVPPMPMRSAVTTSDVTRDSILSERTSTPASERRRTEIRQVARGSPKQLVSPGARTPTRSPGLRKMETHEHEDVREEPERSYEKAALAGAAAAAGAVGATHMADRHDGAPDAEPARALSPIQSEASFEAGDDGLQPGGGGGGSGSARGGDETHSLRSAASASFAARPHHPRPQGINLETESEVMAPHRAGEAARAKDPREDSWYDESGHERFRDSMGSGEEQYRDSMGSGGERYRDSTGSGEHRYRDSMGQDSLASADGRHRDSTGPDARAVDPRRLTRSTDDSLDAPPLDKVTAAQEVRHVRGAPDYVHTPHAVESAVASLLEPSDVRSLRSGGSRQGSYSEHQRDSMAYDRDSAAYERDSGAYERDSAAYDRDSAAYDRDSGAYDRDSAAYDRDSAALDRGSPLKKQHHIDDEHDEHVDANNEYLHVDNYDGPADAKSPRQSVARSLDERSAASPLPQMTARAEPLAHEPLPDFVPGMRAADSRSDISTNPPAIQGPRGGPPDDAPFAWSRRDPTPPKTADGAHDNLKAAAATMLGVAAGLTSTAKLANRKGKDAYEEPRELQEPGGDDYGVAPPEEPLAPEYGHRVDDSPFPKDEGYITGDANARSPGALTPDHRSKNAGLFPDDAGTAAALGLGTAMAGADDPFTSGHKRHFSGNSHGMPSPVYDSATGRGIDRIQSKDIVALMDHVRDFPACSCSRLTDRSSSRCAMRNVTHATRRSWSRWSAAPPRCVTRSKT